MLSSATSSASQAKHHPASEEPLRVLLCAGSLAACAELERLLTPQSGVYVVGAIRHTSGLALAIAENDPDVLVLQLRSQSRQIHWQEFIALGVPIVLLVESADLSGAAAAVSAGVPAVITGGASGAEIAAACAGAASGFLTLSRDLSNLVRHGLSVISHEDEDDFALQQASSSGDLLEPLTLREREVLEMMSEGLSNKEIAVQLNISANTVKFHISSILGKLGASSRTEAATLGLRRGLITI